MNNNKTFEIAGVTYTTLGGRFIGKGKDAETGEERDISFPCKVRMYEPSEEDKRFQEKVRNLSIEEKVQLVKDLFGDNAIYKGETQ